MHVETQVLILGIALVLTGILKAEASNVRTPSADPKTDNRDHLIGTLGAAAGEVQATVPVSR
jgi:hypothetical protein